MSWSRPRRSLEAIPGVGTVRNFAYPYGDYDARVIAADAGRGLPLGPLGRGGLQLHARPRAVRHPRPEHDAGHDAGAVQVVGRLRQGPQLLARHRLPRGRPRQRAALLEPDADPDPCLGRRTTRRSAASRRSSTRSRRPASAPNVVTVQQALDIADAEMHSAGGRHGQDHARRLPTTNDTVTADPSGFSDPDGDALTYQYQWKVNGDADRRRRPRRRSISPRPDTATRGDVVAVDVSARDPKGHVSTGVSDSVTVKSTTAPPPPPVTPDPVVKPVPGPNPPVVARRHAGAEDRRVQPEGAQVQGRADAEDQDRLHRRLRLRAVVGDRPPRRRQGAHGEDRAPSCACRAPAATSCG